uniref:Uncharacterized protein LOC111115450 isoform X2 n=1 Tax=Crassostrea virginica TaxID=6565 RepID=A0A8B8C2K2_CRAVI|nr:uncharacterized protein LOC111115450 isoform X2 [Crassostrea virginica]
MARTILEKLLIVLYVVTVVLWLISMFTQGWLVYSIDFGDQTYATFQMSLFYYKNCLRKVCITKLGTDDDNLEESMLLIELVLIIRMTVYNATEAQNHYNSISFKVPYSIIIAGVGWLAGVNGCVVGYIHHSSLKKNNREREGPNQESTAYAHTVRHTDQPPPYGQPPLEYTNVHAPPENYSMPMYTK